MKADALARPDRDSVRVPEIIIYQHDPAFSTAPEDLYLRYIEIQRQPCRKSLQGRLRFSLASIITRLLLFVLKRLSQRSEDCHASIES